jgi:hypothetical protein
MHKLPQGVTPCGSFLIGVARALPPDRLPGGSVMLQAEGADRSKAGLGNEYRCVYLERTWSLLYNGLGESRRRRGEEMVF